jgi:hypothetical protein
MSNKDEFNRIAAYVLQNLDAEFPKPIFRLEAKELVDEKDEDAVMIFSYTVEFLQAEGLLTYMAGSDMGLQFSILKLTGKGLTLLNSIPDVMKGKLTFRRRIKDALKGSSKEALKMTINQLIKAAIEGKFDLPGL